MHCSGDLAVQSILQTGPKREDTLRSADSFADFSISLPPFGLGVTLFLAALANNSYARNQHYATFFDIAY